MHATFDDSSVSCSRDIIGGVKSYVGYMTLTTLLFKVICHIYAGT